MLNNSLSRLFQDTNPTAHVPDSANLQRATQAVLDLARELGSLPTVAAWQLEPLVAERLRQETGFSPCGGWCKLVALLAGTDFLDATKTGFVLGARQELPHELTKTLLIEAFTQKLVPPTTAASTFLALGVHPAWGLRLAWQIQHGDDEAIRDVFATERLAILEEVVATFLCVLLEILCSLETGKSYRCELFGDAVAEAVEFARAKYVQTGGFEPFLDKPPKRIAHVLAREVLSSVLVPAGAGKLIDGSRFVIAPTEVMKCAAFDVAKSKRRLWYDEFQTRV
jgi:hypothetical protein